MSKVKNIIFSVSLILILLGAILFSIYPQIAPYILTLGVAAYGVVVFTTPYPGKNIRGKRLFNMQVLSVLLMCAACYLMFIGYNLWVVLLLISAFLIFYSVQMIAKIWEREQKEEGER